MLRCLLVALMMLAASTAQSSAQERPNIVVILADDMGFSDIGAYGGEIETPNLDRLAAGGVKFSRFYNTARCCPTRASLMTGLHPAQTGIGHMTQTPDSDESHDRGVIGFRGHLNDRVVTVAEVLRDAGYATLLSGKWHLGYHDQADWPLQRGFDRFYGLIPGASNYFDPSGKRGLTFGNDPIAAESTTDGRYYTTDAFTDWAIKFVSESLDADAEQPFFLYLAYTAPHWPLQAHEEEIAKYRDAYADGWEEIREQRFERQKELGLFNEHAADLSPKDIRDWASLADAERAESSLRMAIYAAMIDRLDQNVGKLLEALEANGELDNTLILFLSDNGGCAEGDELGSGPVLDAAARDDGYFITYGRGWANVSNTPFRLYKHFTHEGGIATPFIAHWPAGIEPGDDWRREPAYLPDLMATFVDLAGATYPSERSGQPIPPMEGVSLRPAFAGKPLERGRPLFFEHEGNRAIREGQWKLVSRGPIDFFGGETTWELYDTDADRSELNNVIDVNPEVADRLKAAWWQWAQTHAVVPRKPNGPTEPK